MYRYAIQLKDSGDYEKAIPLLKQISNYNDASYQLDTVYYAYGAKLYDAKDYKKAYDQFNAISSSGKKTIENDELYIDSIYQYGLTLMSSKKYNDAIGVFNKIKDYKDSASKITEAKYQYILSHKSNTDKTTYTYIKDLRNIGYADTSAIYNELYRWYITDIKANTSESDTYTDKSSISKSSTAYFHFTLKGGAPGDKATIRATSYYTNGTSNSTTFEDQWTTDSDLYYYTWWESPSTAPSTTQTVTIYVNGVAVGTKTVSRP